MDGRESVDYGNNIRRSCSEAVRQRQPLQRSQTGLTVKVLNAEETEKLREAQKLLRQLKAVTAAGDLGRYVTDVDELGVVRIRARSKRSREKALERTVVALENIPAARTASMELDLAQLVAVLGNITRSDDVKFRLQALAEPGRRGITLDEAIERVLRTGESSLLSNFESDCWRAEHFAKLLFVHDTAEPRPDAYRLARQLLRVWLCRNSTETCLRENGPAPELLKCFLTRLATFEPASTDDDGEDGAEDDEEASAVFQQMAESIARLPSKLLSLLRSIQISPRITPEVLLTFLCLRHYVPLVLKAGMTSRRVKQLLHFCQSPPRKLRHHREKVLRILRRLP